MDLERELLTGRERPVSRILVAEDDDDIRDLLVFKLAGAGHDLTAVMDGPSALTAASEPPDLVLLDVNMPGMSGYDVCRALRSHDATSDVPILLLTAKGQEADIQRGFDAGADDYIVKPFSPRELLSRVEAVLARSTR